MKNIKDIRNQYMQGFLNEADVPGDPIELFSSWWEAALEAAVPEPNAMTLATVNQFGRPSARILLLKGVTSEGFEFFTNYQSQKALEIDQNPFVTLVFHWKEIERQVRIDGIAAKLSFEQSQAYFQSRPRGSQIGAWSSPQSQIIPDRTVLDEKTLEVSARFENVDPIPCPPFWGGYNVSPMMIEFWQGRPDRLHDRLQYLRKEKEASWSIHRLAP
jgi:pyridoxamine 5'-phosphate oxidase